MSRSYLEFRSSELGDSSWRRTLRTLDLNDYKELVSNMKLKPPKMTNPVAAAGAASCRFSSWFATCITLLLGLHYGYSWTLWKDN